MCRAMILVIMLTTMMIAQNQPQQSKPAGAPESGKTKTLETGSKMLQKVDPVKQLDIYLVGFHPMKDDPRTQVEAHHYCKQVNEDFAQCALFDGSGADANLNGIEYIISEKVFETLPAEEKQYWHPHNYEILSGELAAPGLPDRAEKELMKKKINSYGKTWHVWMTGVAGQQGDKIPMGAPHLAWSFNHDGEITPGMVESRDTRMKIDTGKKRRERADLAGMAHPQEGVNVLKGKLPGGAAPAGVKDKSEQK
jgi:Protein of unknown function (DUF1264)